MHDLLRGLVQGIVAVGGGGLAAVKFAVQAQVVAVIAAAYLQKAQAGDLAVQVFQGGLDGRGVFFLVFLMQIPQNNVTYHADDSPF